MVQNLLTESLEKRGNVLMVPHPVEWLTDNGSCYIVDATGSFASSLGFIVCTTPVRSPENNGNRRFKSMKTAYATIKGIEVRALRKGKPHRFVMMIPWARCTW